jgi:hypothetical protein
MTPMVIFTCLNDKKLEYVKTIQDKNMTGFIQTFRIYETVCCQGCKFYEKCAKGKSYRRIRVNPELERHKRIARKNLTSEKGLELRKRREPEIESFFGDLKHNQKY